MRIPPRLGALIAVTLWGISFVATKAALRDVTPVTLIFSRFLLGSVTLWIVVALGIGRQPAPPAEEHGGVSPQPGRVWPQLAIMGFLGVFVHQMLQAHGLTMTSAVHAGWLVGLTPLWSAVLSAIVLRERLGVWKIAGLLGGFLGALLVITRGQFGAGVLALPSTRGDLLFLISTLNWAIYSIVGHGTIRRLGATRATTGATAFGVLMLAPFFIAIRGWRELPHVTGTGCIAILFLGFGCSAAAYLLWYGALAKMEVSRVAAFLYIEPLVTFVAAMVLLNESVSPVVVIGGTIVLGSVVLMQYAPAASPVATPARSIDGKSGVPRA
jgi:drug/metabolite transporter (DMT)-like permease